MSVIRVEKPGFLATVQDLGRPGFAALGVSASGAADPIGLRIGNRLVGNDEGAAAIEMTLLGGAFRFEEDATIAIAGASVGDRALAPWRAHHVPAGGTLACVPLRCGARAYLCVRGGIDAPLVLGSASTHLVTGLGGLEGRALLAGDRLSTGDRAVREPVAGAIDPGAIPGYRAGEPLRVTDGPQAGWFADAARSVLVEAAWTVTEACDRMGIRLDGPALDRRAPRELVTEGVALGAIQVAGDGQPIVLFVEHQTTGGYPKIANVIAADLARLGQLSPRDRIRFERVSLDEARAALFAQEAALRGL